MKYSYRSEVDACGRAVVGAYVVGAEWRAPRWGCQGVN